MFAAPLRAAAARSAPAQWYSPAVESGSIIPYDYAATFRITGRPGNLVQDVINVSPEGVFVAVAIGYGFEEERELPIFSPPNILAQVAAGGSRMLGDVTLGDLPLAAVVEGFRLNPRHASWIFGDATADISAVTRLNRPGLSSTLPDERIFGDLLQRIKVPEEISFLFSLVDSGTGREFQDQPAHNLASLGRSDGERPFRLLAQPFYFSPRSTLRVQITERTEGVRGTLFVVLFGYKILGASTCPEPVARRLRGSPECPVETIGSPQSAIIPFDYVAALHLTGVRGNMLEDEIPINVDGGFVATTIGYGLAVEQADVNPEPPVGNTVDLAALQLRQFPIDALLDGIRLRPSWMRVALQNNGVLANQLPQDILDKLFERLNRPEDVAFRYAIFDTGTGRELQNQRLNNVAGLGIANGDRPFKRLARPMVFLPRSVIRVEIEELFGRGTLNIVFQGYKLLERGSRLA